MISIYQLIHTSFHIYKMFDLMIQFGSISISFVFFLLIQNLFRSIFILNSIFFSFLLLSEYTSNRCFYLSSYEKEEKYNRLSNLFSSLFIIFISKTFNFYGTFKCHKMDIFLKTCANQLFSIFDRYNITT